MIDSSIHSQLRQMTDRIVTEFRKLRDINTPIILIEDFDYARIDEIISAGLANSDAAIREWNPATGITNFENKEGRIESLDNFLAEIYQDEYKKERFIVLKDIGAFVDNPRVNSFLQLIAQRKLYDYKGWNTTIVIVSPSIKLPEEILKYSSYLDIPFPDDVEIDLQIDEHLEVNDYKDEFREEDKPSIRESLKGLSRFDIDRVLDMAMSEGGTLSAKDNVMIKQQKKNMVKKSGLVEYVDTTLKLEDIGGLDHLKQYLNDKKTIITSLSKAKSYGVKTPKGIFIVGMPGCGKSLCAKAVSTTFGIPLLKMDMGSMMQKYVGESESNLRNAIKLAEATAPCVLWIDEIEKAFSGTGGHNDILTRMFGYFLSWMQEKTSSVYVVATANSADNLPPELKRKGRFDEIFCVNLPTEEERKAIFDVHYNKIKSGCEKKYEEINFTNVASDKYTKGFNGADIEAVINETVERCYIKNIEFSEKEVLDTVKATTSISRSCATQIAAMESMFKESCFKDATTGDLTNQKEDKQKKQK